MTSRERSKGILTFMLAMMTCAALWPSQAQAGIELSPSELCQLKEASSLDLDLGVPRAGAPDDRQELQAQELDLLRQAETAGPDLSSMRGGSPSAAFPPDWMILAALGVIVLVVAGVVVAIVLLI